MIPDSEFHAYVARAEARLATAPNAGALREHYARLAQRFELDLQNDRDVIVSCAAALMLIEALLRSPE